MPSGSGPGASSCPSSDCPTPSGRSSTPPTMESLNARYRRAVQACGHFPNEQAALKRLYLATLALDPTGRGRQRWNNRWKSALNEFDVLFDGRGRRQPGSNGPAAHTVIMLTCLTVWT
ncbi:transposase [Actinacidiphila oryziradicis]|uniref:Transposase n=1 Tax=Actinacidiphila oryziradicis TaxID=2571141 RepID=A0A4U0RLC1_9ACTN|nr:transposase [Actinacidiphila oryziradicis]